MNRAISIFMGQEPSRGPRTRALCATLAVLAAAGCTTPGEKTEPTKAIHAQLDQALAPKPAVVVPPQISDALQSQEAAAAAEASSEPRFDLIVNAASAREVFLAMVTDTRYSMLMHPEVSGVLSVTLRAVTVREALEAIRDVYGYDFKMEGRRITVYPPTLQTRIFSVNYLNAQRNGKSEVRVSSGAIVTPPNTGNVPGQPVSPASGQVPPGQQQNTSIESSRLSTISKTDFWGEVADALRGIVGNAAGRNVVVSPQSGIIAVRAMPDELRQVEAYLKATRIAVERQVMLEAKIVDVQLRDGFQSGVDWSILRGRGVGGVVSGQGANNLLSAGGKSPNPTLPGAGNTPYPTTTPPLLQDAVNFPQIGAGLFGLSFMTQSFEGVLSFLETQGNTQILSSPRVATLNNQKAVLKVGTDDYFVTSVTGGTVTTGTVSTGNTTTLPTITLTSFFSGIALDVTPQIDQGETITLHVHPSVTTVTEVNKQVDLGTIGTYRLPLPSSSTNETDTIVRVTDGNIVAIGGLMQLQSQGSKSGLPGSTNVPLISNLLGNQQQTGNKRELVVLIKPTIIRTAEDWREQMRESRDRLDELAGARRVITINGAQAGLNAK
jgi:MSHA biogenesis protein MshL